MTNNLLDIRTPAQSEAAARKADYGLANHGLTNLGTVYWNLPVESLYEESLFRREGQIANRGPLVVRSGKHTARAANDKIIVREPTTEEDIWWGEHNRPYSSEQFNALFERLQGFLQGRDLFVQDCYAGADPDYRMPVRVITEYAWHSLFAQNMFLNLKSLDEYKQHVPEFTVMSIPSFKAFTPVDSTNSETFIALDFQRKLCLIGASGYGGEIKKSIFTVLNYLLPNEGVMTMHCSANANEQGEDVALFFGLSGTGKTTLSTDPARRLIGDDEHGWSDQGIFNFEGGSYAKVIRISASDEPLIHAAAHRFGTILENVSYDPVSAGWLISTMPPSLKTPALLTHWSSSAT